MNEATPHPLAGDIRHVFPAVSEVRAQAAMPQDGSDNGRDAHGRICVQEVQDRHSGYCHGFKSVVVF